MKTINFYTIFPRTENIHLTKDVGMVPFILHRFFNFNATLVSYKNSPAYPYLDNEVKGLKLDFLKKTNRGRNFDMMLYIFKHFRKIDVLQLYHFEVDQLDVLGLYILLRKIFFKKSFTWIKCDGSSRFTDTDIENVKFKNFRKWVMHRINIYTVETTKDFEIIKNIKSYQKINLELMPNGFYDDLEKNTLSVKKEKIILTVGRLGTYQKNTEFLLEAFKEFSKRDSDWRLILVGSIEKQFEDDYLKQFQSSNPQLNNRVIFTGSISNKNILDDYYRKASIFVMPSIYESFALVVPEAMAMGCYLLLSEAMTINNDVFDNANCGKEFSLQSPESLMQEFDNAKNLDFDQLKTEIQNLAYSKFYWPNVLKNMAEKIDQNAGH